PDLDAIALTHRSRRWGEPHSFRHHRRCQSQSRYVHSAVRLEPVFVSGDLRCATGPNLSRSVTVFAAEFRGSNDDYLRASDFDGAVESLIVRFSYGKQRVADLTRLKLAKKFDETDDDLRRGYEAYFGEQGIRAEWPRMDRDGAGTLCRVLAA